ncbi:MAG: DNA polymerase III subunit delta, partial [Rhizobiaceae bacterium]|nr:DNA polymerase III subunit delta [Rhizobiaceae bacterium]
SGTGKALAEAIAEFGRDPPKDATIVVEGGDMKKGAAVRLAAEKGRAAMALPCFQDEARALDQMIDEELRLSNLAIPRAAREALRARLGANRLASRGEVRKLCLYCLGQTAVSEDDVGAIVGDVSVDTVDETIDACASGEVKKLPALIARLTSAGTQAHPLQQGLLRYLQALQAMRQAVEIGGQPVSRLVESRRPHFKRKAAMETALGLWTLAALGPALAAIETDILKSRKEAALSQTILEAMLLKTAVEAARLRTRGGRG